MPSRSPPKFVPVRQAESTVPLSPGYPDIIACARAGSLSSHHRAGCTDHPGDASGNPYTAEAPLVAYDSPLRLTATDRIDVCDLAIKEHICRLLSTRLRGFAPKPRRLRLRLFRGAAQRVRPRRCGGDALGQRVEQAFGNHPATRSCA
jgi:hypothetical protein